MKLSIVFLFSTVIITMGIGGTKGTGDKIRQPKLKTTFVRILKKCRQDHHEDKACNHFLGTLRSAQAPPPRGQVTNSYRVVVEMESLVTV